MTARVLAVLLLGGLLVVALVVAGVLLLRESPPPSRVAVAPAASLAPGASSGEDFARASCVQLRLAAQGILAGGGARDVRTQLASARSLAASAVQEDGRWAPPSGGVAALDEAVRRDDGGAAAAGLRVALQECDAVPAG